MKWKFIFNTNHNNWKYLDAVKTARDSGYKFFNWNGNIYFITKESDPVDTGIKVDDCS